MTESSLSFGMVISVLTRCLRLAMPSSARVHPLAALEGERLGDHADRQRAKLAGDAGDDRRGAGPGAAAHAGRDEDHVGAAQEVVDQLLGLLGGALARPAGCRRRRGRGSASRRSGCEWRASERASAWASVLTATNSTPWTPAWIMRFTAFEPPPPTPTTTIRAADLTLSVHRCLLPRAPEPTRAWIGYHSGKKLRSHSLSLAERSIADRAAEVVRLCQPPLEQADARGVGRVADRLDEAEHAGRRADPDRGVEHFGASRRMP